MLNVYLTSVSQGELFSLLHHAPFSKTFGEVSVVTFFTIFRLHFISSPDQASQKQSTISVNYLQGVKAIFDFVASEPNSGNFTCRQNSELNFLYRFQ